MSSKILYRNCREPILDFFPIRTLIDYLQTKILYQKFKNAATFIYKMNFEISLN